MPSIPTIAVLSNRAPFAAVLASTLRRGQSWRVREFSDRRALIAYMRLAPVALLISDYELAEDSLADLASTIRVHPDKISPKLQIIALVRAVDEDMRLRCVQAGIDEVIAKPMSPIYLEERAKARLAAGPSGYIDASPCYIGPERRGRLAFPDRRHVPEERRSNNVISFSAHRATKEPSGLRPDA